MISKRARWIVLEGVEGVGKSTQVRELCTFLRSRGYKVLETKEPGSPHNELTMILRSIMLDNKFDDDMTMYAREFISQAIRSIHIERVIMPALYEYDFIIQDRGMLSGFAYGTACGNSMTDLMSMAAKVVSPIGDLDNGIYDTVIYLRGNVSSSLERALSSKKEFETGDAMESRGSTFLDQASSLMSQYSSIFCTIPIDVDNKTISQVHGEILEKLSLKDI